MNMLKFRVSSMVGRVKPQVIADRRITGRALQSRRKTVWLKDPRCACCKLIVAYPDGFELDHVVPLHQLGEDSIENCQILCKICHKRKTEDDSHGIHR